MSVFLHFYFVQNLHYYIDFCSKEHTYEEAAEIIYRTYEYYIYRYPQKRFHGKTAYQVRQEALAADKPEQYPIAPNRRIERFWEKIEKSKAKQQVQAQQ